MKRPQHQEIVKLARRHRLQDVPTLINILVEVDRERDWHWQRPRGVDKKRLLRKLTVAAKALGSVYDELNDEERPSVFSETFDADDEQAFARILRASDERVEAIETLRQAGLALHFLKTRLRHVSLPEGSTETPHYLLRAVELLKVFWLSQGRNSFGGHFSVTNGSPTSEAAKFVVGALLVIEPGLPSSKAQSMARTLMRRANKGTGRRRKKKAARRDR